MPASDLESELQLTLQAIGDPTSLPPELPLAHLTAARWLTKVLDAGCLVPRSCKVFQQQLLYFSYGGVFYRTSKIQTENTSELPVAMVFRPQLLDSCVKLFPFDSGAMAGRLFGEAWHSRMKPFDLRFSVRDELSLAARLLVHCCYENNSNYIEGRPSKAFAHSAPTLKLLHDFLSDDMSNTGTPQNGVDHRQRSIELLTALSIPIADELIWIGLPHSRFSKAMKAIRRLTRTLPQVHAYHYRQNFYPDEYATELEAAAREQVIKRYLK